MQGCILSPLLFNILLDVVMALALDSWESGVKVSGTRLSNLRLGWVSWSLTSLFSTNTAISETTNLRFADDISLLANSAGKLQQLVNRVHFNSGRFGLHGCQWFQDRSAMHWMKNTDDEYQAGYQQSEADRTLLVSGWHSFSWPVWPDIERQIGLASGIVRKLTWQYGQPKT